MALPPLIEEIDYCEPVDALAALPIEPGLVLLDSAMKHAELGRWSWLALDPFTRFTSFDGNAFLNGERLAEPPIKALRRELQRFHQGALTGRMPFRGGASGFFSYEAGHLFERLPAPKWRSGECPEIDVWFHDIGVAFDAIDRRAFMVSTGWPEEDQARRGKRASERLEWMRALLQSARRRTSSASIALPREAWRPNMSKEAFKQAVERTRRFIADGDIFQANITQAFRAALPESFDPLVLYTQLRRANPATFGALILTPERIVASTSPEGFLRLEGDAIETRPIKGTQRRSSDPEEDHRLADALLASDKDRAENIMIVDLMRNDLSRVSLPGTVEVPVLCGLESYAAVHHLVSVVRGKLRPGLDALDLVAACFPGGSITGAPKIRAMEIIHALEPDARGVYCGSIVHFGYDGSLRSSIAIRTLIAEGNVASIHAGGGITLLSDAEDEYLETLVKAERMFAAFEPSRLPSRSA